MSEAHDFAEHMEHAAHGSHGGSGNLGKYVGITMAVLGVLLAFCSALVGAERTELIATMVEQTNTAMKYQTITTKYRMLVSQLTQLHALCPDPKLFATWDEASKKLSGEMSSPDLQKLSKIIRLENAKNLNAEIPTREDLMAFVGKVKDLEQEQEAAEAWKESFEPSIKAHTHGSEHYEWAQLSSEIGIVLASIALLFMSRSVWIAALLMGTLAVGILVMTHTEVSHVLHEAEAKIAECAKKYEGYNSEGKAKKADEELLHAVEHDAPPEIKAE